MPVAPSGPTEEFISENPDMVLRGETDVGQGKILKGWGVEFDLAGLMGEADAEVLQGAGESRGTGEIGKIEEEEEMEEVDEGEKGFIESMMDDDSGE